LRRLGGPRLHRWLSTLDQDAAASIHPNNVRRVIRALEVTLVSGKPISELQKKYPPPYDTLLVGLRAEREALYERIDRRVEQMMSSGLLQELLALRDAGYGPELPSMSGLGYRQLWEYLQGDVTLEEAVERIKFETHRFVRHQNNWFAPDDPRIHWFDATREDLYTAVERFVESWLGEQQNSASSAAEPPD
jgi:tRNA dimethylallyltransferase